MSAIEFLTARIPPDLKRRLKQDADAKAQSLNKTIVEALEAYCVKTLTPRMPEESTHANTTGKR